MGRFLPWVIELPYPLHQHTLLHILRFFSIARFFHLVSLSPTSGHSSTLRFKWNLLLLGMGYDFLNSYRGPGPGTQVQRISSMTCGVTDGKEIIPPFRSSYKVCFGLAALGEVLSVQ